MGATHGHGTTLTWNGVVLANLTNINGVEVTADMLDVTPLSASDFYDVVIPGLIKSGEISLEGYFDYTDTTGQVAMLTDMNARTSRTWTITLPTSTGATWTGPGYVSYFKAGDANSAGAIPFSARIKPSGKPTFAIAASNNLSNLVFTTATLYPTFAAGTYTYAGTTTDASFTVTPTFSAGVCTITAGGVSQGVLTGAESSAISAGASGTLTPVVIVVAETGKAPKTYTINIAKTA